MPTYSTSAAGTVGAGSDKVFEFDTVTIASGEQFKRCKIEIQGSYTSNARLRGNAQSVLGQSGWNTWTTDRTAISWPNNGKKPKVTVHNIGSTGYSWRVVVTIESEPKPEHTITCSSGTGGTLTANKSKAIKNETITLTPTPATGYQLSSITTNVSGVTVSNNKFTMPDQNITVTATWTKINYTITKAVSPAGAGTVSGSSSAQMGTSVTMTQTPNTGYYFDHWSISSGTISSGGAFTMPAGNVTVTAHYLQRSTATLDKTTLKGGDSAVLTINTASSSFSHKYLLSFGTGMASELTTVAAGTSTVTISIPTSWANEIPNAETKTGGTLKVETYSGKTKLGEYTISSLAYQVPDEAVPSVADITATIERTIGGTTYANVGDYYIQSHCGVEIESDAAGTYSATIASMTASVAGYTGSGYTTTVNDDEIDFTTGLLTIAGETQITVTATDSRGRTAQKTATITVLPYTAPSGTLTVERADVSGQADDVGEYGLYRLTKQFTEIGSNTLTVTLSVTIAGTTYTATAENDSGDLLPGSGNRKQFQSQNEYTVTMTLADSFETAQITATLRSAKFVMHIDSGGDRMALFKAVSKTIPAGKTSTFEISEDTQVYIGNVTLEAYIQSLIS